MNSYSGIRCLYIVTCFRYSFAKFPLILLLMSVVCLAMTNAAPRYQHLCGGQPMRATDHICCGGQLQYKNWFSECCGTEVFDYRSQYCCNGVLQEKPNRRPACCGTKAYDAYSEICCGLGDIRKGHNCRNLCGGQPMRATDHICCDGQLRYKNRFSVCCGKDVYDYRASTCCNGVLQAKPYHQPACCGTEAYDGYSHRCCGVGRPYVRRQADGC